MSRTGDEASSPKLGADGSTDSTPGFTSVDPAPCPEADRYWTNVIADPFHEKVPPSEWNTLLRST